MQAGSEDAPKKNGSSAVKVPAIETTRPPSVEQVRPRPIEAVVAQATSGRREPTGRGKGMRHRAGSPPARWGCAPLFGIVIYVVTNNGTVRITGLDDGTKAGPGRGAPPGAAPHVSPPGAA